MFFLLYRALERRTGGSSGTSRGYSTNGSRSQGTPNHGDGESGSLGSSVVDPDESIDGERDD